MNSFECLQYIVIHFLRHAAREAEFQALLEWDKQGKEKKPATVG